MSGVLVLSALPFWRWAVAIEERPDLPALPFYRRISALTFADIVRDEFPERSVLLLHRTIRGVEVTRVVDR